MTLVANARAKLSSTRPRTTRLSLAGGTMMARNIPILVSAGVSYIIRATPLVLIRREITSPTLRSFLYYVPYVRNPFCMSITINACFMTAVSFIVRSALLPAPPGSRLPLPGTGCRPATIFLTVAISLGAAVLFPIKDPEGAAERA